MKDFEIFPGGNGSVHLAVIERTGYETRKISKGVYKANNLSRLD